MRVDLRALLYFLGGVLVGVLSLTFFLMISAPKAGNSVEKRPEPSSSAPQEISESVPLENLGDGNPESPVPAPDLTSALAQRLKSARALVTAGRLAEAREQYIQALTITSGKDTNQVTRELASVLRRIAGNDAAALQREAARYEQAIALGIKTKERYKPLAMAMLAKASRLAADQIGSERGKDAPVVRAAALRRATPPQVDRKALPQRPIQKEQRETIRKPTVSPRPRTMSPTKAMPLPRSPRPPELQRVEVEPLYFVQIGPITEAGESSEIAGKLTSAGFTAKVSRVETKRFRVVAGPIDRKIAERRAQALTRLGFKPRIESKRGGRAMVEFGVFVRAERAESLAKRVRAVGYPAQAVRESAFRHLVTVGPHPRSAADRIVRMVQSRFTVTAWATAPP